MVSSRFKALLGCVPEHYHSLMDIQAVPVTDLPDWGLSPTEIY